MLEESIISLKDVLVLTGLKINQTKTEMMWLGKKKTSNETIQNIIASKHIKALGVVIEHDLNNAIEKNLEIKLKEMSSTFNPLHPGPILQILFFSKGSYIGIIICSFLPKDEWYQDKIWTDHE